MTDSFPHSSSPDVPASDRRFPWWVLIGALLLPLLYLPTLTTRFDFIDDGNLVYPTASLPLHERAAVVWDKVVANYRDLGPFRPVLWLHWELAADLLGGSEFGWRIVRLLWCVFATAMLLWLLAELRIPPLAALFAAALAMWNPYRNEIWTSLTLAEGVAMPYALLALVAARRAAHSRASLRWDLLSAACVLAALGCKNTFAALVPAQMFLRIAPDGLPLREGLRRHGWRAALLGLTLLAPVAHYVYFKLNWQPGQYIVAGPTLEQLRRLVSGLGGAISVDFLGVGLALALVAQIAERSRDERGGLLGATSAWLRDLVVRYRAALGAGMLLLLGGVAMYLPMDAMSGRYVMPAVWGLDLALAAVLSGLAAQRGGKWSWAARAALAVGLAAVMVAGVGKQQKFAARARLLWDALEWVERRAPAGACVAWYCSDTRGGALNVEEGIHFQWHLSARGRGDVRVTLHDDGGRPLRRREVATPELPPTFAIWGGTPEACVGAWEVRQPFEARYWAGQRRHVCFLGARRGGSTPQAARLHHEESEER